MKILVEMKHGLGDCVCMLPALKAIRQKNPEAYIALLVNGKANEEIFRHSNIKINKYYYFSLKNRSKVYTIKTLFQLLKERFNVGILATMTPKEKGKALFKLLGIKRTFGEQYLGLDFLTLESTKHFVDRNLDMISSFVGKTDDRQPHLYPSDEDSIRLKDRFSQLKGRKIAVNIGGADKNYYKGQYVYTRNWKKENMVDLVKKLSSLDNCSIFLLGGKLEEGLLSDYQDLLKKDNVYNFVNQTSIGETIYILSQCDCSVGVDTGMQHVADALGKKTISIFGPTNPKTHGAYSSKAVFVQASPRVSCQYCFGKDIYYECPDRKCLNQITSEHVFDVVKNTIGL